jgi:hypothetical protein
MITLNKWYPYIIERQGVQTVAFTKAVEKAQEEYRLALECLKQVKKTQEFELDLYNKRGQQNTIELGSFEDRRRFAIFV